MKVIHVWYHANCWDGFGAAWAVHVASKTREPGKLKFQEVQYGSPLPEHEHGAEVWFLDFSPKKAQLIELLLTVKRVLILDHHKTATAELGDFEHPKCEVNIDVDYSGAWMAWCYFVDGHTKDVPLLIQYIQDRDLWQWKLPRSKAFNANLRSYPRDFQVWDELHANLSERDDHGYWGFMDSFKVQGDAILREQERVVSDHLHHARPVEIAGCCVHCVNATTYFSEIAGRLTAKSDNGVGAAFFIRDDGKYQYALRSRGDVDVSEMAKEYGGGGHANAAGFEWICQLPEWEDRDA